MTLFKWCRVSEDVNPVVNVADVKTEGELDGRSLGLPLPGSHPIDAGPRRKTRAGAKHRPHGTDGVPLSRHPFPEDLYLALGNYEPNEVCT